MGAAERRSGSREAPAPGRDWRKIAIVAGLLLVVVAVDVWIFSGRGSSPEKAAIDRPDLRAEAAMGCYVLRVGPWRLAARTAGGVADGPTAAEPTAPGTRAPGAETSAPDSLPASLEPPARVALLPDSADVHGRDLPSFRAEAIPADTASGRILRWTVRADTLWLLWSEPGGRAGLALFAEGDSLAGYARGVTDGVDASAPAVAWPINCSTLGRERDGEVPRP